MPLKSIIAFLLLGLSATAQAGNCPTSHFEPTTYYGQAFFDSSAVTEYDLGSAHEKLAFQYIEYQSFEAGYEPVYEVSLLQDAADGFRVVKANQFRVVLVRAKSPARKGGKPKAFATSREISAGLAERISHSVAAILLRTRYPEAPCKDVWLDGYTVQAMASRVDGNEYLVGEAYSPPQDSEAGLVVALGRVLRKFVEHGAAETEVEATALAAAAAEHGRSAEANSLHNTH